LPRSLPPLKLARARLALEETGRRSLSRLSLALALALLPLAPLALPLPRIALADAGRRSLPLLALAASRRALALELVPRLLLQLELALTIPQPSRRALPLELTLAPRFLL
jgi:hypothetical protein